MLLDSGLTSERLKGILSPIPTPFNSRGDMIVDELKENLAHWNQYALTGYVVLGSNGESVHLDDEERTRILQAAREAIPSDRLMIAGVSKPSARHTVHWCREAAKLGADAALVLPPGYYRATMTRTCYIRFFKTIADSSPIPIILYNMPRCASVDLADDIIIELSRHANIIGIKDSGGNVSKLAYVGAHADEQFAVLAGSAGFLVPSLSIGAHGGILALANIAPTQCLAMWRNSSEGNWAAARSVQLRIVGANTVVTREWGVPALKAAMDLIGLYGGPPRSPLRPLPASHYSVLRKALAEAGILDTEEREEVVH